MNNTVDAYKRTKIIDASEVNPYVQRNEDVKIDLLVEFTVLDRLLTNKQKKLKKLARFNNCYVGLNYDFALIDNGNAIPWKVEIARDCDRNLFVIHASFKDGSYSCCSWERGLKGAAGFFHENNIFFKEYKWRIDLIAPRLMCCSIDHKDLDDGKFFDHSIWHAPSCNYFSLKPPTCLEEQLETKLCEILTSKQISYKRQYHCVSGRIDVMTQDTIYEIKRYITRNSFFEAYGQLNVYNASFERKKKLALVYAKTDWKNMAKKAKFLNLELIQIIID